MTLNDKAEALTALWNGTTVEQVRREVEEFTKNASIWAGYAEAPECPTFSRGDARYWNERYARAAELITALLTANLKLAEGSSELRKMLKSVLDRESATYERLEKKHQDEVDTLNSTAGELEKKLDDERKMRRSGVKAAFEEGFVPGAGDGWLNNPRMDQEWKRSSAKKGIMR